MRRFCVHDADPRDVGEVDRHGVAGPIARERGFAESTHVTWLGLPRQDWALVSQSLDVIKDRPTRRPIDVDEDHGLLADDLPAVRHVRRRVPHVAGADLTHLLTHREPQPPLQQHAELFVRVGVHGIPGRRLVPRPHQLEVLAGCHDVRVDLPARIDRRALGMEVVVFATVNLTSNGRRRLEEFETAIARHAEVVECYTMAGIWDYVLKIVTRDIAHYQSFARNTLLSNLFIGELHSHIAVTEIKNSTELPIGTQL